MRLSAGRERVWLTVAAFAGATLLAASPIGAWADLTLRDAFLRALPARPATHVAAVVVDEASLRECGAWPWSRTVLASLVRRIREAGASGVALDVLLPEPRPGDEELAAELRAGPTTLAAGLRSEGWLLPAPTLRAATREAHAGFLLDVDGVVRTLPATAQAEGRALPALAWAAAFPSGSSRAIPVGRVLRPDFRSSPRTIPTLSACDLLRNGPSTPLKGRIVLVGLVAAGLGDEFVAPTTPRKQTDAGVLIQASAVESLASGNELTRPPPLAAGALAALLVLIAILVRSSRRVAPSLVIAVIGIIPAGLELLTLSSFRLEMPAITVSLVSAVAVVGSEFMARRRADALLRRASESLTEEGAARRAVAHELKTPLTSLRGLSQFLAEFDLTPAERQRVAGLVSSESTRLSEMVEGLLDLERLRLEPPGKADAVVDLSALVEDRVRVLDGERHRLSTEIEKGVTIRGDASLLNRIMDNLVGNALKFGPEDGPVHVRLQKVAGNAVLEVEDRGRGVPEAERARIFRPLVRGRAGDEVPGLGLGLAFVREAVMRHGGSVSVADANPSGAVFRVQLPTSSPQAASN
ncbi:MAG: CHASE2 domain-containing protein [Acidobacteriota bacterium]